MRVSINFSTKQGQSVPGMPDESFEGSRVQAHARALRLIETKKAAIEVEWFTLIWPRPAEQIPPNSNKKLCMQIYDHTGFAVGPLKYIPNS